MVDVDDLVFDAPWGRVLQGVSFVVRTGAVLGLVGADPPTRSILLRCIAALEEPERGRISVAGLDTRRHPRAIHALLGHVPPTFGLYDALTLRQALRYAAASRGVPDAEAPAAGEAAAAAVGLAERLDDPVGGLTPRGRWRLAFAQAVAHRPRLLLLEEPVTGLDAAERQAVATLLQRFAGEGMTVVASAPLRAELPPGCTDLLELEGGLLAGEGVVRLADLVRPSPSAAL